MLMVTVVCTDIRIVNDRIRWSNLSSSAMHEDTQGLFRYCVSSTKPLSLAYTNFSPALPPKPTCHNVLNFEWLLCGKTARKVCTPINTMLCWYLNYKIGIPCKLHGFPTVKWDVVVVSTGLSMVYISSVLMVVIHYSIYDIKFNVGT